MRSRILLTILGYAVMTVVGQSSSASCSVTLSASYPAPSIASGWEARLIAQNITGARSLLFDSEGHLLVISRTVGLLNLELKDDGGTCISVAKNTLLIKSTDPHWHGLALSPDNRTIYASSSEAVFSWSYDPTTPSVSSTNQTLITGMTNGDHTSRTLLMSSKSPGTLLVSRGSADNIDPTSEILASGHAQIRAFNISNLTTDSQPYDYKSSGLRLGWGLRNSVGLAEEPLTGGIYSVENSADDVHRYGKDVHQDNPGEEMNFHGFLNGSTEHQGGNYGYPDCLAVWGLDLIQSAGEWTGLEVGAQFVQSPNSTFDDYTCVTTRVPPRLTFQAHMAPLDIIFEPDGSTAYVTFHGSWDRTSPVGYKLVSIPFTSGAPLALPNSTTSTNNIMTNVDNSKCPDGCFRPVGLARDAQGRIFMSSDTTNEIWVLQKTGTSSGSGSGSGGSGGSASSGVDGGAASSTSAGSGTGTAATPTPKPTNGVERMRVSGTLVLTLVVVVVVMLGEFV